MIVRNRRPTVIAAPLRKQVIEELRSAIISFEYLPDQRLIERDLCERFDVSRTVIREALRGLEAEGLVGLVPNRGPVVSSVSRVEAGNLYEVREALESLAARCCAMRATPAQKRKLARALKQVGVSFAKRELPLELAAKDEFYRVLCEGAANPVIASTLRSITFRVQMLRGVSLRTPGRAQESLAELTNLVKAIEEGDADAAAAYAAEHVRNAGAAAFQQLTQVEEDQVREQAAAE
jgi:GntR family transcriptional regulator, trigonelline degradation regulator